jgi:hypothetical protein
MNNCKACSTDRTLSNSISSGKQVYGCTVAEALAPCRRTVLFKRHENTELINEALTLASAIVLDLLPRPTCSQPSSSLLRGCSESASLSILLQNSLPSISTTQRTTRVNLLQCNTTANTDAYAGRAPHEAHQAAKAKIRVYPPVVADLRTPRANQHLQHAIGINRYRTYQAQKFQ